MLADEQIEAFFTFGYCVARVSIAEAIIAHAIKTVWDFCPSSFRPNTPESWHGEFQDCCKTQSIEACAKSYGFMSSSPEIATYFQQLPTLSATRLRLTFGDFTRFFQRRCSL